MRSVRVALAWSALLALSGCTAFPVIDDKVCGNGVLEEQAPAYEECDTFVDAEKNPGSACRPAGAAGACHFDCQLKPDGTQPVCPSAMGCAADGVCRTPTGSYDRPRQLSSDVASWLSTADFDGDRRPELISTELADQVQQAHFRLHYFDTDANLQETRTFPRLTTRPIAGKLDDDPQDDLVFSDFRVAMVAGRRDREWIPSTFSSYVVPSADLRLVAINSKFVGDAVALVAFTTLNGKPGLYVPPLDGGGLQYRAPLSGSLQDLAGEPLAADIVEGPGSPCEEVAFAFRGESSFRVLDMCELGADSDQSTLAWRDTPEQQVVRLAGGAKIDSGPLSADVDGDHHVDVLVGAGGKTYWARGNGERLEDVASLLTLEVLGHEPLDVPMPLAAGDITGDGRPEFVLTDRVLASRTSLVDGSVRYFTSYLNNARPWSLAKVVDLNGNGLLDVIAGTEGVPGLSFLNGTARPFPVPARIVTQGPLRLLATGDYDGDLIQDVALIEDGTPQNPSDSLAVAFGNRDKVPLEPVRIAELSGVEQLGSQRDGGLDDVFTASTEVVNGATRGKYTLFAGDADRLPVAPYSLVDFSENRSLDIWNAAALLVGSFSAPGSTDALALGMQDLTQKPPWSQWIIPKVGSGEQPPRPLTGDPPAGALPSVDASNRALSVAGAAADLDGDGFDEALWLMPKGKDDCALLVYDIDPTLDRAELKSQVELGEPCVTPELSAAPLREVGLNDLLLLTGDPELGPRRIALLWNDGSGHFSSQDRTIVADAQGGDVRAFSVFPGVKAGLAFVTDSALHVATGLEADLQKFAHIEDVKGLNDARGVVVIDPNTDRVSDVIVADANGLWLVRAELR